MKADVFPATASLRLDIPSWVPEPIAQCVSAKYAADVDWAYRAALRESGDFEDDVPREYLDHLIRDDVVRASFADLVRDELAVTVRYLPLACDRRMERVWRELSRQRNGAFLHPARPPLRASSAANAKERQDAAMLELFNAAFACQELRGATKTQRQAEQQRNYCRTKADELRHDAVMMRVPPLHFYGWRVAGDNECRERRQKLEDAAQAYKDYARDIYATSLLMSLERKHDGRARWVALTIGETFRALFGSLMYGLTATITSVVLGRKIEPRMVRQWCHPAVKPQKISP